MSDAALRLKQRVNIRFRYSYQSLDHLIMPDKKCEKRIRRRVEEGLKRKRSESSRGRQMLDEKHIQDRSCEGDRRA